MKRMISLSFALLLLVVTVVPAFAASESARTPRGPFALVGTISAIDSTNGTVTVNVLKGNKLVQTYIGQSVMIKTTASTRYLLKTSATSVATPITFADLEIGDPVSVNGTLANGNWTATRITVGASLSCLP